MSERVSLKQAAAELGMSPQGVREYMKRGLIDIGVVLPNIKGKGKRQYFIYRDKLDRVLGKNFKKGVRNGKESKDRRN
jgi:hypothetical protein